MTVPFAMAGEPHTLVADPTKDSITFNSLSPGELLKKILSVLGLAKGDGASDLAAAQQGGKKAEEEHKNPDLKPGAKKSLRAAAALRLKSALTAVIASLSAAAAKLGWKDASKQAVDEASKRKDAEGKNKTGDGKAASANATPSPAAMAPEGSKADGPKLAGDSKPGSASVATPADGKSDGKPAVTPGVDKKGPADASLPAPLAADGKAVADQPKDANPQSPPPAEHKPLDVRRTVAMGSSSLTLHVGGEAKGVLVEELKLGLPEAIQAIVTAVGPAARKALEAASAKASEIAAAAMKPADAAGGGLEKQIQAGLDEIAGLLKTSELPGLSAKDLQKVAPAITNNEQAMEAFKKFQSWEALKKEYKAKKDEASMWQLFHARKAHVDVIVKELCADKAVAKDFGSANNTSDYDISVTMNKRAVPDKVKADRESSRRRSKARTSARVKSRDPQRGRACPR